MEVVPAVAAAAAVVAVPAPMAPIVIALALAAARLQQEFGATSAHHPERGSLEREGDDPTRLQATSSSSSSSSPSSSSSCSAAARCCLSMLVSATTHRARQSTGRSSLRPCLFVELSILCGSTVERTPVDHRFPRG